MRYFKNNIYFFLLFLLACFIANAYSSECKSTQDKLYIPVVGDKINKLKIGTGLEEIINFLSPATPFDFWISETLFYESKKGGVFILQFEVADSQNYNHLNSKLISISYLPPNKREGSYILPIERKGEKYILKQHESHDK